MSKTKKKTKIQVDKSVCSQFNMNDLFERRSPGYVVDDDDPRLVYVETIGEECPICHEKLWFEFEGGMKCSGCFTVIKRLNHRDV